MNREAGWWEGEAADGIIHGGNAPVALSCSKIGPFCFHMALQDLTSHVSSCFLLTDDFPAATGTLCLQNSEDWVPPPWNLALATPIASMTSLPMIASFLKKNHFHHFIIFIISIPSQMSPLQHLPHPINLSAFPMLLLVSFHLSIPKMILFVSSMTALYH